jgi:hypothetical protein
MNRRTLILTAAAAALTRAAAAENTELREAFPTAISGQDNDPRRGSAAGRKRRGLTTEQDPSRLGAAMRYAYSIVDVFSRSPSGAISSPYCQPRAPRVPLSWEPAAANPEHRGETLRLAIKQALPWIGRVTSRPSRARPMAASHRSASVARHPIYGKR